MSQDSIHRGIFYVVQQLGERRWKWEIHPPTCINGLRAVSGKVEGEMVDAVAAAQKAIERQTAKFSR